MSLKCVHHTDRVTEICCFECGKAICRECRTAKASRYYCSPCLQKVLERPERDFVLERSIQLVGGMEVVWGTILLLWGILVLLGWKPPLRHNMLGEWEGIVFSTAGVLAMLAGMGTYAFTSWGRWLQILCSVAIVGGLALLHPLLVVASLFHLYFLSVLLSPRIGEIYSTEYRALLSEGELKRQLQSTLAALKVPAFLLFALIGSFLVVVLFVLILALEPSYFSPTKVVLRVGDRLVQPSEVQGGQQVGFSFFYEHHKIYPQKLRYQLYIDRTLWREGEFLPPPENGEHRVDVPVLWRATAGEHVVRIVLSLPKDAGDTVQSVEYRFVFQIPVTSKER